MIPSKQGDEEWEYPLQDILIQRALPPAKYWFMGVTLLNSGWLLSTIWPLLRAGLLGVLSPLPYVYLVLLSTWVFWLPALGLLWFCLLVGSLLFNRLSTSKSKFTICVSVSPTNPSTSSLPTP